MQKSKIKAFIETSAINYCCNSNIDAAALSNILENNNLEPVVGGYTTYELARCRDIDKTRKLFCLIKELKPLFGCSREELYEREKMQLTSCIPVDCIAAPPFAEKLIKRIENYCQGIFDENDIKFMEGRQAELNKQRQQWNPIGSRQKYKFFKNFGEFLEKFLSDLMANQEKIMWVKALLTNVIKIDLADDNLLKFISDMKLYPALRTFIYVQLYLNFKAEKNNSAPREDRFTDSLQVIEAAYCPIFISYDNVLIEYQAKDLNPDIQPMNIETLIKLRNR